VDPAVGVIERPSHPAFVGVAFGLLKALRSVTGTGSAMPLSDRLRSREQSSDAGQEAERTVPYATEVPVGGYVPLTRFGDTPGRLANGREDFHPADTAVSLGLVHVKWKTPV